MSTNRPNILYIFFDELRADILGCYGHPYVRTPNLDRLAAEGVRFERCWTNNPLCIPARVALMTDLYSRQTRVRNNVPADPVPYLKDLFTFRETLTAAGYQHVANVGKVHTTLSPRDSGFDLHECHYDLQGATPFVLPATFDPNRHHAVLIPGQWPNSYIGGQHPGPVEDTYTCRNVDAAIRLLDRLGEGPCLLRLSLDRPHTPVLPPPPWDTLYADDVADWHWSDEELARRPDTIRRWRELRGFDRISESDQRFIRQTYSGMVTFVDEQVGRLLDELRRRGLDENLLTIVLADHGCSIGDHGMQVKGPYATPDINRVPFMWRWPGRIAGGRVYEPPVQLIDFLPTLADLIDAPHHPRWQGASLAPVLADGQAGAVHEAVFTEADSHQLPDCRSETVRCGRWRFTRYPEAGERELIDTEADPRETMDVAAQHPDVVAEMNERLDAWQQRTPVPPPPGAARGGDLKFEI